MKRKFFIPLLFVFLSLFIFVDFKIKDTTSCAFCNENILSAQTFYKGENVLGLVTHKPAAKGHLLIIPKRHVERFEDLTDQEFLEIASLIKRVDEKVKTKYGYKDYLLLEKNGKKAGQSVPHVHFHYVPAVDFLVLKFFISPYLKPLSQEAMKELAGELAL